MINQRLKSKDQVFLSGPEVGFVEEMATLVQLILTEYPHNNLNHL